MQSDTWTVPLPDDFSLKTTSLSHGWHECSPLSWVEAGRCLQMVERFDGHAYRIGLTQQRNSNAHNVLEVRVDAAAVGSDLRAHTEGLVRTVLSLERDLGEFHAFCDADPTLAIVPKIGGGRMLRSPTMTENIIKALCCTNVNWSQAVKMINRLGQLGPAVRHFVHLNAWPTPTEILRAGESYLRDVCRLGYRTESVLAFCDDVRRGRFDSEALTEMAARPDVSSDELLKVLRSIRGIGPSSAHYLLSMLGRFDRLSIDSATLAHVARTHMKGRKPTPRDVERIYEKYGHWKNLAWWYEYWLTWETGRQIVREMVGDDGGGDDAHAAVGAKSRKLRRRVPISGTKNG